jgi:hypothetical protein
VRDLVRCRETFQREILKSRRYILKFLRRRGFVFREGAELDGPPLRLAPQLYAERSRPERTRIVFGEYLALLEYKLDRRVQLDRQIEVLALAKPYQGRRRGAPLLPGHDTHSAVVLVT